MYQKMIDWSKHYKHDFRPASSASLIQKRVHNESFTERGFAMILTCPIRSMYNLTEYPLSSLYIYSRIQSFDDHTQRET